jgi:glycine C-acetyltransferase
MIDNFYQLIKKEIETIDETGSTKRHEKVIDGFTAETPPRAIINGKKYYIFNSNDYLSLRFHPSLIKAEKQAGERWGTGPGAVRFISGTLTIYQELEEAVANFHQKEAAMIFSSSFVANQGVIFPLIVGQRKDTYIKDKVLVISDELNHRSIIDAIRLAKLPSEQKAIYHHLDINSLETVIKNAVGKFDRVLIITDGVFSMLGEIAPLDKIVDLKNKYVKKFKNGILLIVDDAHAVGVIGDRGRGSESYCRTQVDLIIATFGKALGADGGYVVGPKIIIDYLKESTAPYIYSNPMPPSTAAASLAAIKLLKTKTGEKILKKLSDNLAYFKNAIKKYPQIKLAAPSNHPIQPILIGETQKTKKIVQQLFERGFLTTAISYPVVPIGKDEIRIQINANHTKKTIDLLIANLAEVLV